MSEAFWNSTYWRAMKGALVVIGALVGWPLTALAQTHADPFDVQHPPRWGLNANLGAGTVKGEFSSLLKTPVSGEMNFFRTYGPWRFGLGVSFGSFTMRPPYVDSLEW